MQFGASVHEGIVDKVGRWELLFPVFNHRTNKVFDHAAQHPMEGGKRWWVGGYVRLPNIGKRARLNDTTGPQCPYYSRNHALANTVISLSHNKSIHGVENELYSGMYFNRITAIKALYL